ncbi:uncharacterized protein SAMN05421819_1741 [Bryocella elongata]|uniref:DUF418 domain-containing protein n=1 Tax=Bryocella elongata TaxID=863522 RepID=A0A1H5WUD5_9BACT|nr:DUF418 domain-containing protein [Bryocella elongata]SEG02905.1 uncharacterized protein SAMN05421819_1741 [Bryocella elongata]
MSTPVVAVDSSPIAPGANEELAGPPHVVPFAPVSRQERISTMDTLRGFALMGILLMNITDFALGFYDYNWPLSTEKPVFDGPHWKINTALWLARWVFAEGKMRGMFSMLFGAGVVLLTERAEKRGVGLRVADIWLRRNMWLVLLGMLHGYLIWNGDILFYYGLAGLLFLFPFRGLQPKKLLIWAGCVLLFNAAVVDVGFQTMMPYSIHKKGEAAKAAYAKNHVVTEDQRKAIDAEDKSEGNYRKSVKDRRKDIAEQQKSYGSAQGARAQNVAKGEALGAYAGWGDWLGMMLLGMALYKNGFLPGKLSTRTYVWSAIVGLGIAWPLISVGAYEAWKSHFDQMKTLFWMQSTYSVGRVSGAVGTAALLILIIRSGALKWLMSRVAAVGQMALSNYLLTSLSMQFLFVWGPTHWYGYMEYYKLYIVVLCMWTVNLVWSPIWLKYFQFGPVEWCWRSLTYWKRQPMRLQPGGEGVATTASAA